MSKASTRRSTRYDYVVKNTSLEDIKKKAEFLNQNWSAIRKRFTLPEIRYPFLYRNDYAPLIGTICDEKVSSEDAWAFPEWLDSKISGLAPDEIIKLGKNGLRKLLEEYFSDKWPKNMSDKDKENYSTNTAKHIVEAVRFFVKNDVTPITIFEDRVYAAPEVYFLLRRISGFGPKKAKMIVRDFLYVSAGLIEHHPWFDQIKARRPKFDVAGAITPPIDVQFTKVFCRIFGTNCRSWKDPAESPYLIQDMEVFSMLAFPDQPAKVDELFWNIGRSYCDDKAPNCLACPLRKICNYVRKGQ